MRILIADHHNIFRDGLKSLISGQLGFEAVGMAADGEETLKLVDELHPDILLLDMLLPRLSGMEVLRLLAKTPNKVRTIILCNEIEEENISRVFKLGARGLVLKDTETSTLFKCIRAVMAGQYWIGRQGAENLTEVLKKSRNPAQNVESRKYGLTPREMEVVRAVLSGLPNKEIAQNLSISEQTVKHHITSIFDKLGVFSRLELTLFAIHHGITDK